MLKQAKAQVGATEKLLRCNQKTLRDAEAVVEQFKHDAPATKHVENICKRLRTRRSNCKQHKSKSAK